MILLNLWYFVIYVLMCVSCLFLRRNSIKFFLEQHYWIYASVGCDRSWFMAFILKLIALAFWWEFLFWRMSKLLRCRIFNGFFVFHLVSFWIFVTFFKIWSLLIYLRLILINFATLSLCSKPQILRKIWWPLSAGTDG